MKNMVFFVLLAVLTIAALVGINIFRNKMPSQGTTGTQIASSSGSQAASLTPTGKSLRDSSADVLITPVGGATTKGGIPLTEVDPSPMAGTDMNYTKTGFSPKSLSVRVGTMVVFRNNSGRKMKIGGDFSQGIAVGNGGVFQYQFVTRGTFNFKDTNNPTYTGTIIVTQ